MRSAVDPSVGFLVVLGRAGTAALERWWLLVALYVPNALLAAVAAVPAFFGALALASTGPWVGETVDGGYPNVFLELAASLSGAAALREQPADALAAAGTGALLALAFALLAVPLQWLAYTLASGGVLAALAGTATVGWWGECRRWFWPYLRFGILAALLVGLIGGLGAAAIAVAPGGDAPLLVTKLVFVGLWMSCASGLMEVGRADMMVRQDRRALRAVGRALAALVRPRWLLQAAGVWVALGFLGWLFVSLGGAVLVGVPALALVAAFVAQQALAVAGAWLKVARLSAAVQLAQARRH